MNRTTNDQLLPDTDLRHSSMCFHAVTTADMSIKAAAHLILDQSEARREPEWTPEVHNSTSGDVWNYTLNDALSHSSWRCARSTHL